MSATRDKTQKIAFVYSNLYQMYKSGKDAATAAKVEPSAIQSAALGLTSGKVLKADDLRVKEYNPIELLGARKTAPKPEVLSVAQAQAQTSQNDAVKSLKENLAALNNLHSRLKFMLTELEDLVKES